MPLRIPDRPLVSVVMPVRDREPYVGEAIQSILAQTYPHLELVVVDDGSTDGTPGVLGEWAARDERVRPVFPGQVGVARASNIGIREARGEMYARMDSDDVSLPRRLEVQLARMRERGVEVCGSCMLLFGDQKGPLWFPETHQAIRHELLFRLGMLLPTFLMPIEIARAHPFDEGVRFDNYAICAALAPLYRLGNVPQLLMKHRVHGGQVHLANAEEFGRNSDLWRTRVFEDLFPGATDEERESHRLLLRQGPFPDLARLERAGAWLASLSQLPDLMFRQRMAIRWEAACRVSAELGAEETERVHREYWRRILPEGPGSPG